MLSSKANPIWVLIASVGLLALAFVYVRGQDTNWDLLNYHYFSGFALLNGSYVEDIAPSGLQSFLNPIPNVLAFLSLSTLPFPASAWLIAGVQLLALPLLVVIGRQLGLALGFAKITMMECWAVGLCLLAPLWWSELGTSFTDATLTPMVLLGLHLGLRAMVQGEEKVLGLLAAAGACFGFAAGLKLTNAPFAIAFLMAWFGAHALVGWRTAFRRTLPFVAGLTLGFLPTVWWNIYLMNQWGSPLFPLYNAWFKSPYFDLVNFRDLRWRFESIKVFFQYLWESASGTAKTSEFMFADARLLIFVAIATPALFLKRQFFKLNNVAFIFIGFVGLSFFLWASLFAYQRYVIPVEILFGFAIWVLLTSLIKSKKTVSWLLAACVLLSSAFIKVPDWGHIPGRIAQINPFGINIKEQLINTPARYLVIGHAITYILPQLHKDSQFFGLGTLSSQSDTLVKAAVTKVDSRPLRVLFRQAVAGSLWAKLEPLGFNQSNSVLSCLDLQTDIDIYVVCEIEEKIKDQKTILESIAIDFRDLKQALPPSLQGVNGLAAQESWGRWSNSDHVLVSFLNCLPKGELTIDIRGHAFGPNINKPIKAVIGTSEKFFTLKDFDENLSVSLNNNEECANQLLLQVPKKTSPLELGISNDKRTLGIGLVQLSVRAGK